MSRFSVLIATLCVAGCSSSIDDYPKSIPQFSLQDYFDQPMVAWGVLQDYSAQFNRRFCVEIAPSWQGNQGTLDESFYFADGERQTRVWKVTEASDGSVTGSAGDVIGMAKGQSKGAVFHWTYTLDLTLSDGQLEVFMDDWMYQIDKNRMMNRTYMQKFGITVAELSIFFDKSENSQSCEDFIDTHKLAN